MFDLHPVWVKFKILNQNAPNERHRHCKFLAPKLKRSGQNLADRLLNPDDILGCSDCYRSHRWWGTFRTIFTSSIIFKLLGQLENLTPLCKFAETKFPSVFCLNNVERLCFARWLHRKDYRLIGLVSRVFAHDPGDLGSIPGRVIPKTFKMVHNTSLFNTQQYKVHIKGKVEQSRERSSTLPCTSV